MLTELETVIFTVNRGDYSVGKGLRCNILPFYIGTVVLLSYH